MSRRMRWHQAKYWGRPTISIKDEDEHEDRAARWLAKARHKARHPSGDGGGR